MFLNTYPLFNHGRILKLEMLEQLRDFPRDLFNIYSLQYSNGVISGCDIGVKGEYIVVTKGIIKYENVLYVLKEDYMIPYRYTNSLALLKLRFLGETKNSDFIRYTTEIFIDDNLDLNEDEMELCRFKVKEGAILRIDYVDFEDMSTEYDTVNLINCTYAGSGKSTLSPRILKAFAKEAFKYELSNSLDISFSMMCLQEGRGIEKDLITSYLSSRLKISNRDYSNSEIYEYLVRILNDIKQGRETFGGYGSIEYKRILVD